MISAANIAIFDKTERKNNYYSDKTERNIKYINDKTERYVYFYECIKPIKIISFTLTKLPVRTFLKNEQTGSCLYYHLTCPLHLFPK